MDSLYPMNEISVNDVLTSSDGLNCDVASAEDGKVVESPDHNKLNDEVFTTFDESVSIGDEAYEDDSLFDLNGENFDDADERLHEDDHISHDVAEASNGTKYWVPRVDDNLIPKLGDSFESVEKAEYFYREYAQRGGFDVRVSTKKINRAGVLTSRYWFCSREGLPSEKSFDSLDIQPGTRKRRNVNLKRTGCKACCKIHFVKELNRYEVYKFVEWHNHTLFTDDEMRFSRSGRQLNYSEQKNIFHSCTHKVGVTKAHRLRAALDGGVDRSGPTKRDYHNFRRDMNTFVGNNDAKMLLSTMNSRRKICPEYFFEYKCKGKELQAVFWADEKAKLNYKEFGDAISFDATYRTNKHAMVFVPFVAIDNHMNTVVIGSALMSGENLPNYTWILRAFLKAHGRQPVFVMTDQDASMRQAIPLVFPESKHRFCLWHITNKLDSKITSQLRCTNFVSDIKKLVWSVNLDPTEFESRWKEMMQEYGLVGDPWFELMFRIRASWIPAYFKDIPMSGLMQTTSRSESINAFFNVFHEFSSDLRSFLTAFDNAIEEQRAKHAEDEVKTKSTLPKKVSPSLLEEHAATIYTRKVFFDFQEELSMASWNCMWDGIDELDGKKVFNISQKNGSSTGKNKFKVVQDTSNGAVECSCQRFVRHGLLCRHVLKVLMNDSVDKIPDSYVVRRWTRDLVPVEWKPPRVIYGEVDEAKEKLLKRASSIFERMIDRVRDDNEVLSVVVSKLDKLNSSIVIDMPEQSNRQRKNANIQEFLAVSDTNDFDVLSPTGNRNKGCGTGNRLKGKREKAIIAAKQPKRVCQTCGVRARHDSRNCPEKLI